MHPLYQRLKELDRDTFEKFCFHLIKERHPGLTIKHVEGASGDLGIDAFAGQLDGGATIWQCKSFSNGIGGSQREQIRASLRRCLEQFKPLNWVLCIPIDMDVHAHRWYERLTASYAERVTIGYMQASDMVQELVHRKSLRDQFFPDAIIDAVHLRELFSNTGDSTTEELGAITAETADQYIDRLKKVNARFNYQLVHSRDIDATLHTHTPSLIASVSDESKTIHVFARDVEALKTDPPKVSFELGTAGVSKFNDFIRTGSPQDLGPGEIVGFSSEFDFILPKPQQSELRLSIRPAVSNSEKLPLRVTFGKGPNSVTYDYMEFERTRLGTEEAEFTSLGNLPFQMRLLINRADIQRGGISIDYVFRHREVHALKKMITAMDALRVTSQIEFYDLRAGKLLMDAEAGEMQFDLTEPLSTYIIRSLPNLARLSADSDH